jgi:(E)-4-hydroxy-3-methylbut-2-enyl-diphosphate synthase
MGSELLARGGTPVRLRPVRWRTREVAIGDVVLGGVRPIAVQSMTTTRTADAAATAAQVARLARAGCALVRVTVPSRPDAEALPEIRRLLAADGIRVPLVADIHFTPRLALQVVEHVEKVRVNPGNFSDRKSLDGRPYDPSRWDEDLARVRAAFVPLVDRARELGVALRIGTNHGSLSDRILHRFGDTPEGMVESALEFVRICEERGHRQLVISMKASHTGVMVRAYRLLASRLDDGGSRYPLHLGVTEAGGGDEGRMKSAAGIATLLADGLGDTVRVSLTEDPVAEVPVARELIELYAAPAGDETAAAASDVSEVRNPLDPLRRETARVALGPFAAGGDEPPRVELVVGPETSPDLVLAARPPVELVDVEAADGSALAAAFDLLERLPADRVARGLTLADEAVAAALREQPELRRRLAASCDRLAVVLGPQHDDIGKLLELAGSGALLVLLRLGRPLAEGGAEDVTDFATRLAGRAPRIMAGVRPAASEDAIPAHRLLAAALDRAGARIPLVLCEPADAPGDPRLGTTGRLGALLLDGIGDAVRLAAARDPRRSVRLMHGILQATRRRLEQAEFIACPSCGRTLFDLEETTARIRTLTAHLKLKIGVMGCVVNGPGEMADADYGYVGWGEGKVALFVGREMVERDIPFADAPERLVELIRNRGDWIDPEPDSDPA